MLNSAISGVEHALWDIKGKTLGAPVYELLGGKCRDRIRAYANGWFREGMSAEATAERAAEVVAMGYTALKWDPFAQAGLFIDTATADAAIANVRAVREAVGPNVDLCIEVHGRLSPANAIRIGKRLEEFNPFFYEEPMPPENIDALALVARAVHIPVATGERLFTKWGFKDLFEKQAAAVIQPDICHAGGILELKKIAAMAEVYYVGFAPHNPNGPICTAASIQVDACIPNFLIQEFVISDEPLRSQLQQEPIRVIDGYFENPEPPRPRSGDQRGIPRPRRPRPARHVRHDPANAVAGSGQRAVCSGDQTLHCILFTSNGLLQFQRREKETREACSDLRVCLFSGEHRENTDGMQQHCYDHWHIDICPKDTRFYAMLNDPRHDSM